MKVTKKNLIQSIAIFIGILVAFAPVYLANNYLRQDDLMWEIWPGMRMSDFGYLYYNTVFQLVRPLCMLSFYITDLISIDIHNAVYIRLLSVLLLGVLAIMLYHWQLKFNSNKWLASTFALASFTLPSFHIFAATGNYSLIITALLITFGAAFYWYSAYTATSEKDKKKWLIYGAALFFASLLEYPLSSMYIWTLLFIAYINLQIDHRDNLINRKHILRIAILAVAMMVGYYLVSRLFHIVFRVNLSTGRSAVLNTSHLGERLSRIFDVLGWHSLFWYWNNVTPLKDSYILPISFIYALALVRINFLNGIRSFRLIAKNVAKSFLITFTLFFLAYSPVLATPELIITYRYALATMPILLYIVFWSITVLANAFPNQLLNRVATILATLGLVGITFTGIYSANIMTADGIVGPHEHDFAYIQKQLNEKVLPLLHANKKVVIHAIACDEEPFTYPKDLPVSFEYGMRTCQYQQQVISVIIHSLMKSGYMSNYYAHNTIDWNDKEIVIRDTPWGTLIVNSTSKAKNSVKKYANKNESIITIDTRTMPPYERFEFYKNLLARINKG